MRLGALCVVFLCACGGGGGGTSGGPDASPPDVDAMPPGDPPPTLSSTRDEPPGPHCAEGGTAIDSGPDLDGDGVLDPDEVEQTVYVCDHQAPVLVTTADEPPGPNCAGGGSVIQAGPDLDGDGTLDPDEVTSTSYLCDAPAYFDGDLYIDDPADLPQVADIEHISGNLVIYGPDLPVVSMPHLQSVGGYVSFASLSDTTTISFPVLDSVGGLFEMFLTSPTTIDLPSLHTIGGVLALERVDSIADLGAFSSVTSLGGLHLYDDAALSSLAGPAIPAALSEHIYLSGLHALHDLSPLSSVTSVGYIEIMDVAATTLDLPGLTSTDQLDVSSDLQLTSIHAPQLASLPTGLRLYSDYALVEIDLPALASAGTIDVSFGLALPAVDLPQLASAYSFRVYDAPALDTLALPALTSLSSTFEVSFAPLLPRCVATRIADRLRANGWAGTDAIGGDLAPCESIDWCRFQGPLDVGAAAGSSLTYYGRFYAGGFTDQGPSNQTAATLTAAAGVGPAGTDPATAAWAWTAAQPDPTWDGPNAGEPDNDQWRATVTAPASGSYATAFRFSGDGGRTWQVCDRNAGAFSDGTQDGYQIANAGTLTVP
jgi:hypothetical protein